MEPTKLDPLACARLIVFTRLATGLVERNAASSGGSATATQARLRLTLDDLIAQETQVPGCAMHVAAPLVPPNVALMIASILSSVAVVLWCIAAQ